MPRSREDFPNNYHYFTICRPHQASLESLELRIGPQERKALEDAGIHVEVLRGRAQLAANASVVDVVATCKSIVDQVYPDLDRVLQGHSGKVEISL